MNLIFYYFKHEWATITQSQFFSVYWLLVIVACVVLFPLLWKEKWAWLKIFATFCVFYFTYRMLLITLPYTSWELQIDFLLTKYEILFKREAWQRYLYMSVFYAHIFTSPLVLLAGATQFSRNLMFENAVWHRNIGKLYVAVILFVSAPAGLVMSFYANGNLVSKVSFTILTIIWWIFTWQAYRKALQRKWIEHANFMLRSYALTFSAITLRLYMFAIGYFKLLDSWNSTEIYVMLSVMSWLPNLAIVEILIASQISKKLMKKL
ncbi:DUF2306 domain-containing protein [Raineya orbicola]|jgi:hypothetical protein|uniref:Putative membrane protein n=1 Tax=Raineya orbicola TaxID=2016530 RepID=A0A2N3II96_9BACT|nr:DUF2306 domain-containing protein [Raineya orbicola]PKQ70062.1 putative membrane protein [Raineya orbicola]